MDEAERQQLAQRLSALALKDAQKELKKLDRTLKLKYYRNSIWDEYHSLYLLPQLNISVTLVEKEDRDEMSAGVAASPGGRLKKERASFYYVEARVGSLNRPIGNGTGK